MNGLLTDLYQFTMAAAYWHAGRMNDVATFELFFRRLPPNRNYVIVAGIAQAVEYLLNLRFTDEEIDYLRKLPKFSRVDSGFFDALREFKFTGDVSAVAEGTPMFAGEPILTLRAPVFQAQIPETYLLSMIGFQTLVATKARRMTGVAEGRAVAEFGSRRAHSPEAGVLAARAAYIGGCTGSSNVSAGMRFGIPVFGTSAHSWVMSFPTELEAFRHMQDVLGPEAIHLIDSYDTIEGAVRAASLKDRFWGVRIDSGNLDELSRTVRQILNDNGHEEAKILVTGDLNEHKIRDLVRASAPIDVFGVGTDLATSGDAPSHGGVYKLVEMTMNGETQYTAKVSEDKATLPGSKQVYRLAERDVLTLENEAPIPEGIPLLQPLIRNGERVAPVLPPASMRAHCLITSARLPKHLLDLSEASQPFPVELSDSLSSLNETVQRSIREFER